MPDPHHLDWMEPFAGRLWILELAISNSEALRWRNPRLTLTLGPRVGQSGMSKFTSWEEPLKISPLTPYEALNGLITVTNQFQIQKGVTDRLSGQ